MTRKRVGILAVLVVLVCFTFAALGPRVSSMFSTAGASLSGGSSSYAPQRGSGASAPAAPAAGGRGANDLARPAEAPAAQAVSGQGLPAQTLPTLDRLVIRNVSLTLVVPNVRDAYYQVEQIAAEHGGLIAGSQIRPEGERTVANVTVRVPADTRTYQSVLDRFRGLAERVLDEQGQVQDVTEEHVDLESRLRNLQLTEQRLLTLYDKAHRIEEIFAIQRELTNVRGQIEQAQGRKDAIERRAAMATITLQLREPASVAPRHREWSPLDVAADAVGALAGIGRGLTTAAIWLVVWLPVYGVPLLVLWLLRGRLRALLGPRGATPA
jgi:hypothetical protein